MKPGCYGLPSIYHADAPGCVGCGHKDSCASDAYAKAIVLSVHVPLDDVLARLKGRGEPESPASVTGSPTVQRVTRPEKVKVGLTEADYALIAKLPVKVAKKVKLLMERNADQIARVKLGQGINPFPLSGAGYLHVACELLLGEGFTRTELREEYMRRFNWTEGTAFSHVSNVVAMFPALRLAKEINGRFFPA